jgi:hypothetical protein
MPDKKSYALVFAAALILLASGCIGLEDLTSKALKSKNNDICAQIEKEVSECERIKCWSTDFIPASLGNISVKPLCFCTCWRGGFEFNFSIVQSS